MGTYNGFPASYNTFGKVLQQLKDQGGVIKSSVNYLGKVERFKDPSKTKSKSALNVPGPGHYPMIAHWAGLFILFKYKICIFVFVLGKQSKKEEFNYLNKITTGIEKSIYQS